MTRIHPTAIIDPEVILGENVEIGPWCYLKGKIQLGDGCVLEERVSLEGPLVVGKNNYFSCNAAIGRPPQDYKFEKSPTEPGILIGEGNTFREGVTIHRATHAEIPTRIGNNNFLMANSHVAHDCHVHNNVTMVNGTLLGGHSIIEERVVLSGNSAVHQFARVGRLSMVAGCQGLTQDMPPFCICYHSKAIESLNYVGLRRAGYRQHVKALKRAFELCFKKGLNNKTAVKAIEEELADDPLCMEFAYFVKNNTRGLASAHK